MDAPTFSESWHRIAQQHVRLRPDVILRRQNFRGERWYVVEDPLSNRYFRIRPEAYDFLVRLGPQQTVEEVWNLCLERYPDRAPGQQECVQLLSQLYQSNLLHYDLASDAAELFRRQQERQGREFKSKLLSIMFARIPLFDPDRLLTKLAPLCGKLIGPLGALLWLIVVGLGLKTVVEHWPALLTEGRSVVAPENIFLLYVGLIFAKVLHEFGHALFCKCFGGQVHTMGVMLLIFTPVPYVDVTSSWGLRSRKQRMLIGAAGMIVEVFLAALVAQLWARSGPGAVHSVCYNIMFVASVSTLVFNLNPLLRFDGYYILSDWLDIPNLQQRAQQHLKHLWKRYVFGLRASRSPAVTPRETWLLTVFGILSGIYRVVVFAGVLLMVADRFLIIGMLMAVVCLIGWIVMPTFRLLRYLAQSPELDRARGRAVATSLGLAALVFGVLQWVPFPSHFTAQGVVQAVHFREVVAEAPGYVQQVSLSAGQRVEAGQELLGLRNFLLDATLRRSQGQLMELDARLLAARTKEPGAMEPLSKRLLAAHQQDAELLRQQAAMKVNAPISGEWSFLPASSLVDTFVPRGGSLGVITQPGEYELIAAVLQADADRLFGNNLQEVEVKISGQAETTLQAAGWDLVPGARSQLPSLMLGSKGGGDIPVRADDPSGRHAAEPFYLLKSRLPTDTAAALRHGQLGTVQVRTGSEALLPRWWRKLRQFLQERYRL